MDKIVPPYSCADIQCADGCDSSRSRVCSCVCVETKGCAGESCLEILLGGLTG